MNAKLLIVDDDPDLRSLLSALLQLEGFSVETACDGRTALTLLREQAIDLVLLDVMMPGLSGFEVLSRLRQFSSVPVIMLTARGEPLDRVQGLEGGADDYLAKPFDDRELIARIRALLRRMHPERDSAAQLTLDDMELNVGRQEVVCQGQRLELTSTEFQLLRLLLQTPGQLLDKEHLHREALGRPLSPYDRSLDVHISNLRKKLPPRGDGLERIRTVRGKGYIWLCA